MPAIFDSHLHFNSPEFEGQIDALWREANQAGVERAVVIGYNLETSKKAIEIASQHEGLYATVGVSPHDMAEAPEGYLDRLVELATKPKVVGIGEAGLEYHYPVGPKELQIERFSEQIELANRIQKPIVIHLRDADEDFLEVIEDTPPDSAILHCFTASIQTMQRCVENGYFISFSGIVTFKKAVEVQEAAKAVPLQYLLIETDSPYLAPTPFRGKRCEPRMIIHTAERIAEIRETDTEEIAQATFDNACRIFGLE